MEYSNDLLLIGVTLILVALLFSRPSKTSGMSQSEMQWLRRKIDLIQTQTNFMLKNIGALDKPPADVMDCLKKGDNVHATQKLREHTGLGLREAQAVIDKYKTDLDYR